MSADDTGSGRWIVWIKRGFYGDDCAHWDPSDFRTLAAARKYAREEAGSDTHVIARRVSKRRSRARIARTRKG